MDRKRKEALSLIRPGVCVRCRISNVKSDEVEMRVNEVKFVLGREISGTHLYFAEK